MNETKRPYRPYVRTKPYKEWWAMPRTKYPPPNDTGLAVRSHGIDDDTCEYCGHKTKSGQVFRYGRIAPGERDPEYFPFVYCGLTCLFLQMGWPPPWTRYKKS